MSATHCLKAPAHCQPARYEYSGLAANPIYWLVLVTSKVLLPLSIVCISEGDNMDGEMLTGMPRPQMTEFRGL